MVSKTSIQKVLRESIFDPKKDRRMAIIVEGKPQDYLIDRAIEFLREAAECKDAVNRGAKVRDAISILAAARLA